MKIIKASEIKTEFVVICGVCESELIVNKSDITYNHQELNYRCITTCNITCPVCKQVVDVYKQLPEYYTYIKWKANRK